MFPSESESDTVSGSELRVSEDKRSVCEECGQPFPTERETISARRHGIFVKKMRTCDTCGQVVSSR
jgi:RNA polymerase-binding transcription factor DksA